MRTSFQIDGPEKWQAQVALAPICEDEKIGELYPELDKACPWLAIAPALRDFTAKKGEIGVFYGHPDLKLPRVMALGLGKRKDVTLAGLRRAFAKAARKCQKMKLASALLPLAAISGFNGGEARVIEECVFAYYAGLYHFYDLKTKKDDLADGQPQLYLACANVSDNIKNAVTKAESDAYALALARDLDNLPGNLLYPESFALRASELAGQHKISCKILDENALAEIGAGCLLAVGHGAGRPPRLVVLEYQGAQEKPLALVGKGLTFDSGGLCLKPAANMDQMKCDMSGAAAVLAAICAAAREGVERHIVGVLPLAENMPDGKAYRPGDVLTALNGESVEVINTDAEGRLALADALSYAQKNFTPKAIVDIATLTGACAVALGKDLAGLFCDNDKLSHQIQAIGEVAGENFWRLPLWDAYRDSLKSEIADIKHTASREGGAITAALFLKNFVAPDMLWAHMDIAGVDWNDRNKPMCPVGPTGFGSRVLLELARQGID